MSEPDKFMARYLHLLLDADGTLYDFHASESYAIEVTCKELGIPYNEETLGAYMKANGQTWRDLEKGEIDIETLKTLRFQRFFDALDLKFDATAVGRRFMDLVSTVSVMFPKSLPILKELKRRGYKLYLVTNGVHEVQMKRLTRKDTEGIYEGIFTPHVLGAWKPAKEALVNFFKLTGIDEEGQKKSIMIGDSLTSDIKAGINVGIDTLWYNPKGLPENPEIKPTYQISDLDQLLDMFPPLK